MLFLLGTLAVIAASLPSVLASPLSKEAGTFSKSSIFEKKALPPTGWKQDDSIVLDKDSMLMKLRIHLVQHNMPDFHDLAMKIATPGHELYGRHLSQSVIDDMVAPKDESLDLVMKWLESQNLGEHSAVSSRGDSVIIEATISQIEQLLKAEYSAFSSTTLNNTIVRTLEYSLPNVLKGHVDIVQPTTYFGMRPMRSTISAIRKQPSNTTFGTEVGDVETVTGCSSSGVINPKCLANLYSFSGIDATQTTGLLGIAGFLEQYPSKSDLSDFLDAHAVFSNTGETYTCTKVNSGSCPSDPSDPGDEANLDVQYARAITAEIPNTFYSTGGEGPWVGSGTDTNEPYLEFLDYS
jgi:tripeptidyl-peptidase-1